MKSKLIPQRPGSSARVYDDDNLDYENSERRSRIPKMPKRTYSLEGKDSTYNNKRSSSRQQISTTSMIPRPEWKKYCKKVSTPESSSRITQKFYMEKYSEAEKPKDYKLPVEDLEDEGNKKKSIKSESKNKQIFVPENENPLENKINDDFINFKNNVLRIPEYWTDAGQTVTNILKNAINIVTKQYPSADVETFEAEIQNILKATEAVKQQILTKTDTIINQANKIYLQNNISGKSNEELMKITNKMEEILNDVTLEKSMLGDWFECSSQMKQLLELESVLQSKQHDSSAKEDRKNNEGGITRRLVGRKSSMRINSPVDTKRREKNLMHSCGDVLRKETRTTSGTVTSGNTSERSTPLLEDKSSQTINLWTAELNRRDEVLNALNNQILELHQLCKDHISKFKSFNLQIKLRGLCSKAQNVSTSKEIQILNDEKLKLAEKNSKLQFANKDLESAIKQKDIDIHQKDRLISQQKKLLYVRDELIEMLKTRCNIEEVGQL